VRGRGACRGVTSRLVVWDHSQLTVAR
jgi:hypothetical protein